MTGRYRILVSEQIADSGVALLRERFDVDLGMDWSPEELRDRIGDYDGILIRSATRLTADIIAHAGNLKVIGRAGIGIDNVDVDAATKRGIVVANAPQSNIIAAAEHTVALMLALARNVPQAHGSLTAGRWERSKFGGVEVYEKTLGILGFGRIGRRVARRALGFDMTVLYHDTQPADAAAERSCNAAFVSMDELLARADILTIHIPYAPATHHLVSSRELGKMKPGAILIHASRGGVVDDAALVEALKSGRVAGAGLDVFENEPNLNPALLAMKNVVLTPHIASSSEATRHAMAMLAAQNLVAALTTGTPPNLLNPKQV